MAMKPMTSKAAEAAITRLLWREQIAALPRAIGAQIRRLLRREPRWYYVVEGRVVARITCQEDYDILMQWIATVHAESFHYGVSFGTGVLGAVDGDEANTGNPGPS